MAAEACHPQPFRSPREVAKECVQRALGVESVARWTFVEPPTVYQWLSRGTDVEPIPPRYVALICAGALREGIGFDPSALWPGLVDVLSVARLHADGERRS